MTIIVSGRLVEAEAEARNQTAVILPSDGTQLGVIQGVQGGLTLTKTSGMGWQLDIGRCVIAAATPANGPVVATVTVAETGVFAPGDATRNRIDIVTLLIDETATVANGNPRVKTNVIQGAYPVSGSPVAPAVPAGQIPLWSEQVNAGISAGSGGWDTSTLKDLRGVALGKRGRIELTASNSIPNANTPLWGVGPLTADAAATKTTDGGLVAAGTDTVTIRDAGEYSINWYGSLANPVTGRSFLSLDNTAGTNNFGRSSFTTGENTTNVSCPSYVAAAGEVIKFNVYQTSGASNTLTSRIRIARVQ
jgi:hypothetical protein